MNPKRAAEQPSDSPSPSPVKPGVVRILIVEDNPADVLLIREALLAYEIEFDATTIADGQQTVEYIERIGAGAEPCPQMILLDLNLPRVDGYEILRTLRRTVTCKNVPVVVVTSSDAPADRSATAALGADGYFRKPTDFDEFLKLGALIKRLMPARQS